MEYLVAVAQKKKQPRAPNAFVASEHPDGGMINFVLMRMKKKKGGLVVKVEKKGSKDEGIFVVHFFIFSFCKKQSGRLFGPLVFFATDRYY